MTFDDRFFPQVDVANTDRYGYYFYRNKDFIFDKYNEEVLYVYKDDSDIWRKVDSIAMNESNWDNKDIRKSYLDKYVDSIEDSESLDYEEEDLVVNDFDIDDETNEEDDMLIPNEDGEVLNELQRRRRRK